MAHPTGSGERRRETSNLVTFLRGWARAPMRTGALFPSGRALGRTLAAETDPARPGLLVELGGGTGEITRELIARGWTEERLVVVELDPEFAAVLRHDFPRARIVEEDARALPATWRALGTPEVHYIVSGLPLLSFAKPMREEILRAAFDVLAPGGAMLQYTYGIGPSADPGQGLAVEHVGRVWLNAPPAAVWRYVRRDAGA